MAALTLEVNALHKVETEYHGKFGHNLGSIQNNDIMIIIEIYYTYCRLETQTVSPIITGFQGIKRFIKYLDSNPHKPIFYPSNSYNGSNVIRLTWSGNKVKYYTPQNCLECHQDADHVRISTEDGQFQVLFIISLVLLYAEKYRFNQI